MVTDAERDTRSPWYEAFAPQSHPPVHGVRWIGVAADEAESADQPEAVEPDGTTEALFDCYNS